MRRMRHHPSSITSTSDIVMLAHAGHGREFLAGRTGEVTLTRGSELAGDRAPKISFLSLSASLAQKTNKSIPPLDTRYRYII